MSEQSVNAEPDSTQLPAPLVPDGVRFKHAESFPLSGDLLRYGALVREPDARVFRAVVTLMEWAWRGKPAASIDDCGKDFHRLIHEPPQWWRRHSAAVLAHFVKCSDGRYYHPDLAQRALALVAAQATTWRLDIPPAEWVRLRSRVFARDEYRCVYCGAVDRKLDCDHVVPLAGGGKSDLGNLVTACFVCNRSKGAKSVEEWMA